MDCKYKNRKMMKIRITVCAAMLIVGSAIPSYASTTVDVSTGLNFGADSGTNQTNTIGALAGVGFTHRYNNVFSGVDAILTVVDVDNIDSDDNSSNGVNDLFDNVDRQSTTTGKAIDINIDIAGETGPEQSGSATLRADFVQAGTNNPVTLQNISINVADIDSNQYVSFSGITAYELSSSPATQLTVSGSAGVYEFKEPSGNGSIVSDQDHWALVEYASANSISWTVGARESGSAFFSVSFEDATWSATPTRPTFALTAFNLTYNTDTADSGSAPTTQSSTTSSSAVTLVAAQGNLTKSNCALDGWNTREDGTGANYQNGNVITLTSSTTLFAKWNCSVAPSPSQTQVAAPAPAQAPAPTATPALQAVAIKSVPTLANTGASELRALFAVSLVGIGILLIAFVRRPVKS